METSQKDTPGDRIDPVASLLENGREGRIKQISEAWVKSQADLFHTLRPARWEELAAIATRAQKNIRRHNIDS